MRNQFRALARDATFIPFVYDYCDMWCERCPLTARCLLVAAERLRPSGTSAGDERLRLQTALALSTAVIEASSPEQQPVARLDLALCDVSTAPKEPAIGHPLEFLGSQYGLRVDAFLASLAPVLDDCGQPDAPLQLIARYHWLIPAKIYRALVSHYQAAAGVPELMADALGTAKIALILIDRSLSEWRSIAARDDDARVEGLMELLQALRTGVEIRFPEARAFVRPGLDDGSGAAVPTRQIMKPARSLRSSASFERFVLDQLSDLGEVSSRKMFGGVGLYSNGVFFGIIARDALFLKVDAHTRGVYERAGMLPFRPFPGRPTSMGYYGVPVEVLESGMELTRWARDAVKVAMRARAGRGGGSA